jgi:hypothetical protein
VKHASTESFKSLMSRLSLFLGYYLESRNVDTMEPLTELLLCNRIKATLSESAFNLRCSRVFLHLNLTRGVKLPPSVSQDLRHLGMKFQRLPSCFRGRGTQWRYRKGSILKPEVRNSRWRLPNRMYLYLSF